MQGRCASSWWKFEWEKELIGKHEQLHEGEQKLNEHEEHIVSIVNH
jgi:hypothetical protein